MFPFPLDGVGGGELVWDAETTGYQGNVNMRESYEETRCAGMTVWKIEGERKKEKEVWENEMEGMRYDILETNEHQVARKHRQKELFRSWT